jgi:isoleucyl-tRNA synthetase
VLITSEAHLLIDPSLKPESVEISVAALGHPKCNRCWHLRDDVGANAGHPNLCGRCVTNLFGAGEHRGIA